MYHVFYKPYSDWWIIWNDNTMMKFIFIISIFKLMNLGLLKVDGFLIYFIIIHFITFLPFLWSILICFCFV